MKACPFCAEQIPDTAQTCPFCKREVMMAAHRPAPRSEPRGTSGVAKVFWVISMIAAVLGGVIGLGGAAAATGAPQEASAAAMGCLIAIAPYVFARGIDALTR